MKPDKKYTGEVRLSPDALASIDCTVLHTAAVLANKTVDCCNVGQGYIPGRKVLYQAIT